MPRRQFAVVLLACCLAACTTWHVEPGVSPLQLIATRHPGRVRITRSDSSEVVLYHPRVAGGDTLVGDDSETPAKVPVSDVRAVAVSSVSTSKTIVLGLGLAVIGAITAVAVAFNQSF
jgi:hypothetical protein